MQPSSRPMTAPPLYPSPAPVCEPSQGVPNHLPAMLPGTVQHPHQLPVAAAGFPPWPWQPRQIPVQFPPNSQHPMTAQLNHTCIPAGCLNPQRQHNDAAQQPASPASHCRSQAAINFTAQHSAEPESSTSRPGEGQRVTADAAAEADSPADRASNADPPGLKSGEADLCTMQAWCEVQHLCSSSAACLVSCNILPAPVRWLGSVNQAAGELTEEWIE